MGAGRLQARAAATAEKMGHQRAAGPQATELEGPHIKVCGGRRVCFINHSIQEANCKHHLTISDEKQWLPTEMSQSCTQCLL